MKDKNQAGPSHVYAPWAVNKKNKWTLPPSRPCVQENGLRQKEHSNMIVTARRVCANDESNSHLKRLAEFLSLVLCGTNPPSVTTFDVLVTVFVCMCVWFAFTWEIHVSHCLLGIKFEKKGTASMTKPCFSVP